MQTAWLIQKQSPQALVVFLGWGMDPEPWVDFPSQALDVVCLYDYRTMNLPLDCEARLDHYPCLHMLAWSMGVWAAQTTRLHPHAPWTTSVALNGTPHPIHPHWGIPPQLYTAWLENFSLLSAEQFYRDMFCTPEAAAAFLRHSPRRLWTDQQLELKRLAEQTQTTPVPGDSLFQQAWISRHDRIFPARNQIRYWKNRVPYRVLDEGHFPFGRWASWDALVAEAAHE